MASKTIIELVDDVHAAAIAAGMDVSPQDVGYILSLFFQGLANNPPETGVEKWLYSIADECDKVKGE